MMGRTTGPDDTPTHAKKGDRARGPRTTQSRTTLISKAFSKLLRHQAVNEKIPITSDGWVRLDHLLSWRGLVGRNGIDPLPTIEEVWQIVESNEKKRFAVRRTGKGSGSSSPPAKQQPADVSPSESTTGSSETQGQSSTTLGASMNKDQDLDMVGPDASGVEAEDDTARAITYYRQTSPSPSAAEFEVRAVQGHSIKSVASDTALLQPISLDDPSSIPDTCVHGTFYGAWSQILQFGGLSRMGRNHVHFARGPSLGEMCITEEGEGDLNTDPAGNKVISGMRSDAQLLIYVDLKRCLEDVKDRGLDMLWWRSQNGVILTEGINRDGASGKDDHIIQSGTGLTSSLPSDTVEQQHLDNVEIDDANDDFSEAPLKQTGGRHKAARSKAELFALQSKKLVPIEYWKVVVDVRGGNGVIWTQKDGVVKQLPQSLLSKVTPKWGRGRGRGRQR